MTSIDRQDLRQAVSGPPFLHESSRARTGNMTVHHGRGPSARLGSPAADSDGQDPTGFDVDLDTGDMGAYLMHGHAAAGHPRGPVHASRPSTRMAVRFTMRRECSPPRCRRRVRGAPSSPGGPTFAIERDDDETGSAHRAWTAGAAAETELR